MNHCGSCGLTSQAAMLLSGRIVTASGWLSNRWPQAKAVNDASLQAEGKLIVFSSRLDDSISTSVRKNDCGKMIVFINRFDDMHPSLCGMRLS